MLTSVLCLGFRHAPHTLQPWAQLTTGRPAALEPAPEAAAVAQNLAQLLRCDRALLAPSTLHPYWDLFDVLAKDHLAIHADAGNYPTARGGIERVAARGIRTTTFAAQDSVALEFLLHRDRLAGCRPVVVTDRICTETGRTAPLRDYLKLARERDGYLVIDDTQALGILGREPGRDSPYGPGGAGSPSWHGVEGPELIIGNSLANGSAAPLAILASNARLIAKFEKPSASRVHSSPPSLAVVSAVQQAVTINATRGDLRRARLAKLVQHFRDGLREIGLSTLGGLFPVQTLQVIPDIEPQRLYRWLLSFGVRAVLRSVQNMRGAVLSFVVTLLYTGSDIGRCVDALQQSCMLIRHERGKPGHALGRAGSGILA